MYLKVHLNNKDSNDLLYEANTDADIFESFKNYYGREWNVAIKSTNNYEIPDLK